MFSLSHVSVKQRTADPRRSEFLPLRRSSLSFLLLRERTFSGWIEGSGGRSPIFGSGPTWPHANLSLIQSSVADATLSVHQTSSANFFMMLSLMSSPYFIYNKQIQISR
ncbi:hypothetical protein AMECASPLE_035077 [Ameca splendens]|uniref:Uncharacterized protein n=1 Tax=Ameca splendens TaxID=208324 RepID=A0ABV0XW68_9TELE